MKRANIVREMKIIHTVVSSLLLLSGVFLVIWPDLMTSTGVRFLFGLNLIVVGVVRLLGYFANDLYRLAFQYDMAVGGFSVVLGVLIFICPEPVLSSLPYVLGSYVLLDGLLKMQTAFDAKAFGMPVWVGLLVTSVLVSIGGIAVIIVSTQFEPMTMAGVALILDGAENVWNTLATVRVRTKKEKRFEDEL